MWMRETHAFSSKHFGTTSILFTAVSTNARAETPRLIGDRIMASKWQTCVTGVQLWHAAKGQLLSKTSKELISTWKKADLVRKHLYAQLHVPFTFTFFWERKWKREGERGEQRQEMEHLHSSLIIFGSEKKSPERNYFKILRQSAESDDQESTSNQADRIRRSCYHTIKFTRETASASNRSERGKIKTTHYRKGLVLAKVLNSWKRESSRVSRRPRHPPPTAYPQSPRLLASWEDVRSFRLVSQRLARRMS